MTFMAWHGRQADRHGAGAVENLYLDPQAPGRENIKTSLKQPFLFKPPGLEELSSGVWACLWGAVLS